MRNHKTKLLATVSFISLLTCSSLAYSYETTTFSVSLGDSSKTGTISIGNTDLGDGTTSITAGSTVYNTAFQYFTPTVTGTYVFGQLYSPADTAILLYSPTFSTSNPTVNFVSMNDDGDPSSISDAGLQSYVTTAIAGRSCSQSYLCPLLEASLTAGVDYYVVVSTYGPGVSLGGPTDNLTFFVIGDALVGVGGVPATGYVDTAAPTAVSGLAEYLNDNDNSGDLATVASFLDTASEAEVTSALKEIFPVNGSISSQITNGATGQTSTVLLDKVGTVLGNIEAPAAAGFANGAFSTGKWVFGESANITREPAKLGYLQETMGTERGTSDFVAALAATPYTRFGSDSSAFWVQGVGALTVGDGTAASHGYDVASAGVVAGYEVAVSENNLIGVLTSVFRSNVDLDDDAGVNDANTYSAGVYAQHLMGATKLTGIMLASFSNYDSKRNVSVGGISGTPKADYNGWGTSTTLSLSRLYTHNGFKIEPFASANFSTATSEGYTETGGGVFNTSVEGDASSTAGLRAGATFQFGTTLSAHTLDLKVRPYAGYTWEINEASTAIRLSGAGSSTVINGQSPETAQVGLSFEANLMVSERSSFKLGVDVSHDRNENRGIAYIGYGVKF